MNPAGTRPSALALAVAAAIAGAVLGSWVTAFLLRQTGLYVPLISGALAGYAASLCHPRFSRSLSITVGGVSFVGAVFTEALIYENKGIGSYMQHFLDHTSGMDWIFRVLNALVGYWFSRRG